MILSNGWKRDIGNKDGLEFYQVLRELEPTTHLVFYDFGEHGQVCGASPEILGSKRGQNVTYSPIAGTRYRGRNAAEDQANFAEMANDPKENAEHDMLVDLGRNDIGKVCEPGSIAVTNQKYGRFFANVMHMVSDISGTLHDTSTGGRWGTFPLMEIWNFVSLFVLFSCKMASLDFAVEPV